MKKILIYSLFVTLLFSQCTPKVGETVVKTTETPVEEVKKPTFRSTAPPAGPAPRIQMGKYEQFTLDNGLKVIVVENHKLPRVSYQLFVDVPAIMEGDKSGAIAIAGDMLNKGTKTKTKSEIDESIDYIGAQLSTNPNGMFGAALKKYNEDLLSVMSDVLLNPNFPEAEFEKLKKQNASNLASGKDDPSTLSGNLSNLIVYGKDHPYGEFMTEKTLEKITLDEVRKYYNTWFKPNISYLVVVGDITPEEVKPLAKQYFSGWKKDTNLERTTFDIPSAPGGNTVSFINKSGAVQSVINVSYPIALQPGSEDVIKASVMNTLLGAGVYFGNRLNQNLREEHAYTYGARSSLSQDKYVGNFAAGASVRNEVTDSSIVEIFNEFKRIRDVKVDEAELQKVKNVLNGAFGRSLESPQTIARFALNTARYNLPEDYYATYLEKLSKVTSDDLIAMAKKYIKPENAHIIVVGNQDEVATKLKGFAKNRKVDFYNTKYEKVELPKQTIPVGTTAQTVINDYLNAIGGSDKIATIKSAETKMAGDLMGMKVNIEIYQQLPDKYASMTLINGAVAETEVLNGAKGIVGDGVGGTKKAEGNELVELKEKVIPFSERFLGENGYTLTLSGIENVEGQDAYKVKMVSPSGNSRIDFYDMESSLKIRSIIVQEQGGQTITQTVDVGDYKTINGVQYPHSLIISGAGLPAPLKMKAKSIKLNEQIDQSVFTIK